MGIEGNTKASTLEADNHVNILIEASKKLRDLVKQMETAGANIKGYIIYTEESEDEKNKKVEDDAKLKALIKQNGGDENLPAQDDGDDLMNEQTSEIIKKFKGKILKEFIPHFMLNQYSDMKYLEYDTFEACVDEYFSQA